MTRKAKTTEVTVLPVVDTQQVIAATVSVVTAAPKSFNLTDAALGLAKAFKAQDAVRTVVGKQFTKGNNYFGWAVTTYDINEKSATAGFRFSGFANQTKTDTIFIPQFNRLDVPMAIFNHLKDAILHMESDLVQLDGFLLSRRPARTGNGAWVTCRVIDEKSPFFCMSFRAYAGDGQRGPYVSPDGFRRADFGADSVSFDLPAHTEKVQAIVADRDAENKIIKGEDGIIQTHMGNAHWAPICYNPIDHLSSIIEARLTNALAKQITNQRQAEAEAASTQE